MPPIVNTPPSRVTVRYVVPLGTCTAVTDAPTSGCAAPLITTPSMPPVVTPCATSFPLESRSSATIARNVDEWRIRERAGKERAVKDSAANECNGSICLIAASCLG